MGAAGLTSTRTQLLDKWIKAHLGVVYWCPRVEKQTLDDYPGEVYVCFPDDSAKSHFMVCGCGAWAEHCRMPVFGDGIRRPNGWSRSPSVRFAS